ncbi:MAG TPA: SpoIID/LytB domain-containing protein, partial [bacterium]|nr:SpoIID/LytB domain-containing protein [bacterium]
MFMRFTLIFALTLWPFDQSGDEAEIGDASPLTKTQLELPKDMHDIEYVDVLLARNVSQATVETHSPFQVVDNKQHTLFRGTHIAPTTIRPSVNGIQMGSQVFQNTPVTIQTEGGSIRLGKADYRHSLKIWRESSKAISVVNEINVEDYLKGVLPWEANPAWPTEALKAQAVASRTFALFKSIEHQKKKSSLSKDVFSQVYKGKSLENPKTDQAIEATKGEILTYNGKIFPTYFHSTCGGHTTRADYVWPVQKHPVLQGVSCNFCWQSKHYRWRNAYTAAEIQSALKKRGIAVKGITKITPAEIDASGRVRRFVIEHSQGKTKVNANEFRIWLDPARFKSTLLQPVT